MLILGNLMSIETDEKKIESNKTMYEYLKNQFDEERKRFVQLEDKSAKYLTLLSVVIPIFSGLLTQKGFIKINNCILNLLVILIIVLILLSISSAWIKILNSLKLAEGTRLPTDEQIFNLFKREKLNICYETLSKTYQLAIIEQQKLNAKKYESINFAFKEIQFTGLCFGILIILLAINNLG